MFVITLPRLDTANSTQCRSEFDACAGPIDFRSDDIAKARITPRAPSIAGATGATGYATSGGYYYTTNSGNAYQVGE